MVRSEECGEEYGRWGEQFERWGRDGVSVMMISVVSGRGVFARLFGPSCECPGIGHKTASDKKHLTRREKKRDKRRGTNDGKREKEKKKKKKTAQGQ